MVGAVDGAHDVAAHKDARVKVDAAMKERMEKITGGLPLPPGMKLF